MVGKEEELNGCLVMQNNDCLLTFVIPMYNASKTINRCLESIYSLDIEESKFEVIAVDDCSTDNTVEVLKGIQSKHTNLALVCQQHNHRQGAARNIGIERAMGEFIAFVDSDDEVEQGIIKAVKMAKDRSLNMVAMRFSKISEEGCVDSGMCLPYQDESVFSGVELQTEHPFCGTAPWAYVYHKPFLEFVNYHFAEDVLFEDSDFVNVHLYYATKMAYCSDCGYRAHYNADSTTHTMSYKHLADYVLLGTRMLTFYESLPDKTTRYAYSILEGGSYNIMKSFRRVFRLAYINEVRAFYDRLDTHFDRRCLFGYRNPAYCWTLWTRLCLKHRRTAILLVGSVLPIYRILGK